MATDNIQSFLEDRLRALEPTIDLDPGSPAQVQFIEPVLTYLGTDPFETDINSFITDRFAQEFPDVFAGDPGVVRDVFIKPLILLLEPFKREIETIKRNQSLKDPTVLSDDDADALVANVFDDRDPGAFATGVGRVLYSNPINVQIEITNRFFTANGLGYFPTNPVSITAEEMVFNKTGTQYFIDVPLKAELEGAEYNIDVGQLSGVDGVFGAVRVTNLAKFADGAATVDTPTFVASAREALNERSLVTRRGATARVNDVFQTDIRAIQVIGAKDPEMERDILVADAPGHLWATGTVSVWKKLALVQAKTIDGEESDVPVNGDTLYMYLDKTTYPSLSQSLRFLKVKVEALIAGPFTATAPYQVDYLVQWSGELPAGVSLADGASFEGGLSKRGTVHIGSVPDLGAVNLSVPDASVHVLGHTDFYVRPILQPSSTAVWDNISDYGSLVERLALQTTAGGISVQDAGVDFTLAGVQRGDLLSIETGNDVGVYPIVGVGSTTLSLGAALTSNASGIRYRVIRRIRVDLFEPKIMKFPFGSVLANDLQSTIGSNLFQLSTNDVIGFGAAVGDTIQITDGPIAGDYIIVGFDPVLGGQGILVDRAATSSTSSSQYRIFSTLEQVERPLVRIKELLLLDSSNQSTGISIPLADPVGVTPVGQFTSARVRGSSQRFSGFVLPSFANTTLTTYVSGASSAAPSGDRRYSLGFDTPVGTYLPVQFPDGTYAELDYHNAVGSNLDPASYFVSVVEDDSNEVSLPPIDPKPGESLSIKNGPNKGDYLIKDVVKFKHKLSGPSRTIWTYFIKIYGSFPVDVVGQLFDFLNDVGGGASVTELPMSSSHYPSGVAYPGFFKTLYESLGSKMNSALSTLGVPSPPSAGQIQSALDASFYCEYDWGDPARGSLRTYFLSPTLFQQQTGDSNPTLYTYTTPTGESIKYRPDPERYRVQETVPPRVSEDTDPKEYPRDLDVVPTISFSTYSTGTQFAVGVTLTGLSSGATGKVYSTGAGASAVSDIVGAFIVGETVTDDTSPTPVTAVVTAVNFIANPILHFTDSSRPSAYTLGVQPGDVVSIHEEIFFHGTDRSRQTAVAATNGSNQLTAPTTSGNIFTKDMVGNLLFIEQGQDEGAYRVVKFIDGKNILIDKSMTESTPTILAQGPVGSWGNNGTADVVLSGSFNFTPYIGKYITLYGMEYNFQGSYEITGAPSAGTCQVSKTPDFPGAPTLHTESDAHFVVTDAPASAPEAVLSGTELVGLRPIRMYASAATDFEILSVQQSLSVSLVTVDDDIDIRGGLNQPFRIYRRDIRRVTPSEMETNQFGPLSYIDTEVVSLSPQPAANIGPNTFLTIDDGTFFSLGYRLVPEDRTLTYSMQENGFADISPRILPIGVADSEENFINLLGSSIQVTYEQSDLVRRVQEFADSGQDRVTSANILVRHFLPAYVSYDATYVGGSAPSVIATDIINYVNNLAVEMPIDVSEVQDLIARRGGNLITPSVVQTLVHDWSRKVWLEFSSNQLGGTETDVPYDGTPRVSFYVPGPDVSGQDPVPSGERISLTRQ